MEKYERAFSYFIQGTPLRKLTTMFGIPKSTLIYYFKKMHGKDYVQLKNTNGLTPILKEYLNDSNFTPKQKVAIKEWMDTNREILSESDLKYLSIPLLTEKRIQSLTNAETRAKDDWRLVLENTLTY